MNTSRHQKPARILERLDGDTLVWLTTVDADGRPQPSLVWFLWDGDEILVYSQPDKPKVRNIAARPDVSLNFNSSAAGGDLTVIRGKARLVDDAPPPHLNPPYIARYTDRIAAMGSTPEAFIAGYSQAIRITPLAARGV